MLDLSPTLNTWLYPALALVLTGLTIWIVARSQSWLAAHAAFLDASTREKLVGLENQALDMGVQALETWARNTGNKIQPDINNPVVKWGAQLALNHASGILADNGLSPEDVAAKLLAKLPDNIVDTDTTGATVKTTTVTVETLPPIGPNT